jgi:hypothetical protein
MIMVSLSQGDIQPTRGGGTSVTFTGIETHRHSKPVTPVTQTSGAWKEPDATSSLPWTKAESRPLHLLSLLYLRLFLHGQLR